MTDTGEQPNEAQRGAQGAGLRDKIAALCRHRPGETRLGDEPPGVIADAVLTVVQPQLDKLIGDNVRLRGQLETAQSNEAWWTELATTARTKAEDLERGWRLLYETNGELRQELAKAKTELAICSCANTYEAHEGREADCPVHGAVKAFNEASAELAELRKHYQECWELAQEAIPYAGEYFDEKWGLSERLSELKPASPTADAAVAK